MALIINVMCVGCSGDEMIVTEMPAAAPSLAEDIQLTPVLSPISTGIIKPDRIMDDDFLRGVAYVSRSQWAYSSTASEKTLVELIKPLGVNWISVIPVCYQTYKDSITIDCTNDGYRADDLDIGRVIDFAHENGFKVMLTPHVIIDGPSDSWRGEIGFGNNESRWTQWFESYTEFITHYAKMAEMFNADYFVVGSEYEMASHREAEWREVVAVVREVYRGPVTYSANYGDEAEITVQWWDALDAIAIDAYYPLTEKNDPTVDELIAAWQPIMAKLENLSAKWDKPIIFTEIGYQSKDGANTGSWDADRESVIDLQEQADSYQAVFEAFADKDWMQGIFWWAWDNNPAQGGVVNDDYEIRGKPAEDVLRSYYGGELKPIPHPTPELLVDESVNLTLYSDMLQNGWQDYSYFGRFKFIEVDNVAEGSLSIKVSLDSWGGLCFAHKLLETDPYYWIEFYINYGKDTSRKLQISAYGKDDSEFYYELNITDPKYYDDSILQPDTWYLLRIPLEDFGVMDQQVAKICIADGSGDGQDIFWIDDIRLVGAIIP